MTYKDSLVKGFLTKREKPDYKILADKLSLPYFDKNQYQYKINYQLEKASQYRHENTPSFGKAKVIKAYIDHIDSIVNDRSVDYDAIVITEEYKKKFNLERKLESNEYKRKQAAKIIVSTDSGKFEISISELEKPRILFYGSRENSLKLREIRDLLLFYPSSRIPKNTFMVVETGKINFKYFKKLKNARHIDTAWDADSPLKPIFKKIYLLCFINDHITKGDDRHLAKYFNKNIRRQVTEAENYYKEWVFRYFDSLKVEVTEYFNKNPIYNPFESNVKIINAWMENCSILNRYNLNDTKEDLQELAEFLIFKKKRVDYKFYNKRVNPIKQLKQENNECNEN